MFACRLRSQRRSAPRRITFLLLLDERLITYENMYYLLSFHLFCDVQQVTALLACELQRVDAHFLLRFFVKYFHLLALEWYLNLAVMLAFRTGVHDACGQRFFVRFSFDCVIAIRTDVFFCTNLYFAIVAARFAHGALAAFRAFVFKDPAADCAVFADKAIGHVDAFFHAQGFFECHGIEKFRLSY